MKDKQLFIEKFNEIIKETMKDYLPEEREMKALHSAFDSIIQSWDLDMRDHGIEYQISYFRKNADEIDKALIKQKANLHPGIALKVNKKGKPLPPDNSPQSYRISIAFLLSSLLKVDRFIIEYLEGLKNKPDINTKAKAITIIGEDNIEKIIADLTPFFGDQSERLRAVINGNSIEDKLKFAGNASQLADYFGRLHDCKIITSPKTETREWIVDTFLFLFRGSYLQFTADTAYDYLKGKGAIDKKKKIGTDWLRVKPKTRM
jgi:hypothetical protein